MTEEAGFDKMTDNPNELDPEHLAPWLEQHVPGFHDLREIRKFEGGQSNPTFMIHAESGNYVLRTQPPGELLQSAHQVDREYRVMKALAETGVPVPRVYALSLKHDGPLSRMFFVMEFLDGHIFWDPVLPELVGPDANERRAVVYDRMNDALAKLHSVDIDAVGLGDFGKPGNYFERQTGRWSRQYVASEVDRYDDVHNLISWLEANMPADDGAISLVHGDFRLDNMVFSHDGKEILGILDWELSTLGHPLADLAYQCMQWRLPHEGSFRGLGDLDRKSKDIPTEEEYVAAYCKRRDIDKPDNWTFYVAFCFFRLAAILQGVYKRSLDGNASNPELAKLYGSRVPILASMAMEMIREKS